MFLTKFAEQKKELLRMLRETHPSFSFQVNDKEKAVQVICGGNGSDAPIPEKWRSARHIVKDFLNKICADKVLTVAGVTAKQLLDNKQLLDFASSYEVLPFIISRKGDQEESYVLRGNEIFVKAETPDDTFIKDRTQEKYGITIQSVGRWGKEMIARLCLKTHPEGPALEEAKAKLLKVVTGSVCFKAVPFEVLLVMTCPKQLGCLTSFGFGDCVRSFKSRLSAIVRTLAVQLRHWADTELELFKKRVGCKFKLESGPLPRAQLADSFTARLVSCTPATRRGPCSFEWLAARGSKIGGNSHATPRLDLLPACVLDYLILRACHSMSYMRTGPVSSCAGRS